METPHHLHFFLIMISLISKHRYYTIIQPSESAYLIPPLTNFYFCSLSHVAFIQSVYKKSHFIVWFRIFSVCLKHKLVWFYILWNQLSKDIILSEYYLKCSSMFHFWYKNLFAHFFIFHKLQHVLYEYIMYLIEWNGNKKNQKALFIYK